MNKDNVLKILQNNSSGISGEEISRKLNISRSAIWKSVEQLRKDGYIIDAKSNNGYFYRQSDVLSCEQIVKYLCDEQSEFDVFDSVESTNTILKEYAISRKDVNDGFFVTANTQTAGKGRMGRTFVSPVKKGVWLSVLFKPSFFSEEACRMPIYAAVAVCNAIENLGLERPTVKWPNDIIYGNKKLCGISSEMSVESGSGSIEYLILGIGVNVNMEISDFPVELREKATSIYMHSGQQIFRSELIGNIINEIGKFYQNGHFTADFTHYLHVYKKDLMMLNKKIVLISPNNIEYGVAEDINEKGELIVRYDDNSKKCVNSGEISVRGLMGYDG